LKNCVAIFQTPQNIKKRIIDMSRFQAHEYRQVNSLDGIWDFCFLGDVKLDEVNLGSISFKERMPVPGCFDATPAYAGKRGLAAYRATFQVKEAVPHRIVFKSVHHWCRVFANGQKVCEHAGGFTCFNVDLPVMEPGEIELVVLVDNRFDPARSPLHMPHFDWYQFGGISRPVELQRLGNLWIEALKAFTERLDLPTLRVCVEYRSVLTAGRADLKIIFDGRTLIQEKVDLVGMNGRFERLLELPGAALWSPKAPNLHTLEVRLGEDDLRARVGLRQVKISGRQILINQQPVKLLGLNRHETHPQFGHALPDQIIAADVQQLVDLGCNFVRGSHYPQDERFLELCDEAGICVWSEGTAWQQRAEHLTDDRYINAQLANLEEMVDITQTHPSVILYGILNESQSEDPAARRPYARLIGRLREMDASRPVTFATHHVFEDLCLDLADVISINCYPGWYHDEIEDIPAFMDRVIDHLDAIGQGNKPLIVSEIGAAAVPGWQDWHQGRWTEQYQARLIEAVIRNLFIEHDRCAGLSIWQFCDARTGDDVPMVLMRARGFNNKGIVDEYRRPKLAYGVVKQLFHQLIK
jgi:beta-glucuronidase